MNQDGAACVPRRAVGAALAALGAAGALAGMGSAAAPTPGAVAGPPAAPLRAVQAEYRRLLPLWQEERKRLAASSRTADHWSGQHGKAIVALGAGIVPQLIQEVRKGDFFFNVPLAAITGIDVADGDYRSEQASAALWLKWWDAGGAASP